MENHQIRNANVVKISRKLSGFLTNPACIAGVHVSSPNFKADKDIARKIENLTISIKKLQEIAERQAEGITAIKDSIENLDVRLKKIEEKIK